MRQPRIHCRPVLLAALALAATPVSAAPQAATPDQPATVVRDLDYGDVLFHSFSGDPFGALVRLQSASDLDRIPHHEADAELLSGGLYVSLGLYAEAGRTFERLLAAPVPGAVRNRAIFYLARLGYEHGYVVEAWQQLQRIDGELPGDMEGERRLLECNLLMAQGRFGEAATRLRGWTDSSDAAAYARFNLGVALVRLGQQGEGRRWLESVGVMPAASEEQLALRDRANLALGYAALQQHDAAAAAPPLERVRLDGPFTNMALLGLGWARLDGGQPERALVPWLALRERPVLDATVQESMLAVPHAYRKLGATAQSADGYRRALDAYAAETKRLGESIAAIRAGGFVDSVLKAVPQSEEMSTYWQLRNLPDAPHTRYLYRLMASHEFQAGLRNYRDLKFMRRNLERWHDSLDAFDELVAARGDGAANRQGRVRAGLDGVDIEALQRRHDELEARVAALAPATAELGTLRGELQETTTALDTARIASSALQQAIGSAPEPASGSAARVRELADRVDSLLPRLDAAAQATERLLADLAVEELDAQQRRLASYTAQAQFALAALYDAAASGGGK
jgi:hypothetical protein